MLTVHIDGFMPVDDERWKQMKAVWDACNAAGIDAPSAVWNFFGGATPDVRGVRISEAALAQAGAITLLGHKGIEVQLDKVPAAVKILRFYADD